MLATFCLSVAASFREARTSARGAAASRASPQTAPRTVTRRDCVTSVFYAVSLLRSLDYDELRRDSRLIAASAAAVCGSPGAPVSPARAYGVPCSLRRRGTSPAGGRRALD